MQVYVESYGCAQNLGEAAQVERSLHDAGHSITDAPASADVGILVSCAVIGTTESRMVRRWEWLSGQIPRVIVTGCLVPLRTELLKGPGRERTEFVPIREQARIPELLHSWALSGSVTRVPRPPEEVGPILKRTAEITIAQGCTSACNYCYSRLARGRLSSTPSEEIERRIADARDRGAVEVRLSSLDTSCWGEDRAHPQRLPELLERVAGIPGEFRVRVGMMSPQSLAPIAARLWPAMAVERFYKFLHLPVQSGSDAVLADMHRGYGVSTFRSLVDGARRALGDPMLSTDVIVGYPGESEVDFRATLDLLEEVEPDIVNVTRFSPRPMTPAARLRPLPGRVVKERSRALTRQRMEIARSRMERWIGRTEAVWVVEAGAPGTTIARLPNYLPVILPGELPVGVRMPVRIEGARSNYLMGRGLDP